MPEWEGHTQELEEPEKKLHFQVKIEVKIMIVTKNLKHLKGSKCDFQLKVLKQGRRRGLEVPRVHHAQAAGV